MSNDFVTTISYAILLVISFYLSRLFWKYPSRRTAFGTPLLGFLASNPTDIGDKVLTYCGISGPIYDMFLVIQRFTVISDLDSVKEIFQKRPKFFQRPPEFRLVGEVTGTKDGLFFSEMDAWSLHRRVTSPSFSKKGLESFHNDIWQLSTQFSDTLTADGITIINFTDNIFSFTMKVIGIVAFGMNKGDNKSVSSYFYDKQFKDDLSACTTFFSMKVFFGLPEFVWYVMCILLYLHVHVYRKLF